MLASCVALYLLVTESGPLLTCGTRSCPRHNCPQKTLLFVDLNPVTSAPSAPPGLCSLVEPLTNVNGLFVYKDMMMDRGNMKLRCVCVRACVFFFPIRAQCSDVSKVT